MEKQLKDYLHLYLGCDLWTGTGRVKLIAIQAECIPNTDFTVYCLNGNIIHRCTMDENTKPLLRPLSSMTEEEGKILDAMAQQQHDNFTEIPNCKFFTGIRTKSADAFLYMLSRSFDLFNLIPDGLAIDSTKPTNP